ncbi:hypothetical protein RhiirA4_457648 [Rhizophagus irregularis]|uniref:Uncharacterized protein n=1 Tax=Rhizophagus irregularis TaxID=588596 RepID=A0A2I1GAI6_9GLOM|nr:hypothetical protein RhiirA4_457648 [Rhizophagus irregularis]
MDFQFKVVEGKQKDLVVGLMQNIMQLESFYHTNMRKRKVSVVFDEFDYLYGIVITERIYCLKDDYHIILNEKIIKNDAELRCNIKKIMERITELEAENAELKAKKTKFEAKKVEFLKSTKKCYTDFEGYIAQNVKNKSIIEEYEKELESKKNRKFQIKCIQIVKEILNEKLIIEVAVPNAWSGSAIIVVLGVGITFNVLGIGSAFNISSADSCGTSSAIIIVLGVDRTPKNTYNTGIQFYINLLYNFLISHMFEII